MIDIYRIHGLRIRKPPASVPAGRYTVEYLFDAHDGTGPAWTWLNAWNDKGNAVASARQFMGPETLPRDRGYLPSRVRLGKRVIWSSMGNDEYRSEVARVLAREASLSKRDAAHIAAERQRFLDDEFGRGATPLAAVRSIWGGTLVADPLKAMMATRANRARTRTGLSPAMKAAAVAAAKRGESARLSIPCSLCGSRKTLTECYFDDAKRIQMGVTACDACGAC